MNFPYLGLKVFTNLDMNDWTEHIGRRLLNDGDDALCQIVKFRGISIFISIWFFMVPRIYVAISGDEIYEPIKETCQAILQVYGDGYIYTRPDMCNTYYICCLRVYDDNFTLWQYQFVQLLPHLHVHDDIMICSETIAMVSL